MIEAESKRSGDLHRDSIVNPEWKGGAEPLDAQQVKAWHAVAVEVHLNESLVLLCRDTLAGILISEADHRVETGNVRASSCVDELH